MVILDCLWTRLLDLTGEASQKIFLQIGMYIRVNVSALLITNSGNLC
jgi:hypothetical protein